MQRTQRSFYKECKRTRECCVLLKRMQKNARTLRFFEKNACPTLPIAHSPPPPLIAGFMSVCIIFTQKMMFYCYLPTVEKDSYILKGRALQKKNIYLQASWRWEICHLKLVWATNTQCHFEKSSYMIKRLISSWHCHFKGKRNLIQYK